MNKNLVESKTDLLTQSKIDHICDILSNDHDISLAIRSQIIELLRLIKEMSSVAKNQKKTAELLRQAMGLLPKKEREGKTPMQGDEPWSAEVEKKLRGKCLKAFENWKQYKAKRPPKKNKKVKVKKGDQANTDKNDNADSSSESVFQYPSADVNNEKKETTVNREKDVPNDLINPSSSFDKRIRFNVNLTITEIEYNVETLRCPITGFSKTATVDDGPAKFRVTYNAIAQITLLVYGMGIPIVRLAASLGASRDYFNPSRIYRLCLHVARACASVYQVIFEDLALCNTLSGDDTFNSVLEMRTDEEEISDEDFNKALYNSKQEPDPQKADFVVETKKLLGSQMPRKDGKGLKKSIFTTVVIGQKQNDHLILYHTERKSFGDILGKILANRELKPELRRVKCSIQSDLSSSNLPNPEPKHLNLEYLGCSAHARRPFWRYRNDSDSDIMYYCYTMLLLFDKIADFDRDAKDTGVLQNIVNSRQQEQKPLWDEILQYAKEIQDQFAPNSDFAKSADYIVNNFAKLTKYLSEPLLKPDNNHAERLLRYEKIMLDNSKFRVTKKGRLAYDIIRTILTTCRANGVDAREYLIYIMKNQIQVRQNPRYFTPYAYAKQKKQ